MMAVVRTRQYTCSSCGMQGHNKTTCGKRAKEGAEPKNLDLAREKVHVEPDPPGNIQKNEENSGVFSFFTAALKDALPAHPEIEAEGVRVEQRNENIGKNIPLAPPARTYNNHILEDRTKMDSFCPSPVENHNKNNPKPQQVLPTSASSFVPRHSDSNVTVAADQHQEPKQRRATCTHVADGWSSWVPADAHRLAPDVPGVYQYSTAGTEESVVYVGGNPRNGTIRTRLQKHWLFPGNYEIDRLLESSRIDGTTIYARWRERTWYPPSVYLTNSEEAWEMKEYIQHNGGVLPRCNLRHETLGPALTIVFSSCHRNQSETL